MQPLLRQCVDQGNATPVHIHSDRHEALVGVRVRVGVRLRARVRVRVRGLGFGLGLGLRLGLTLTLALTLTWEHARRLVRHAPPRLRHLVWG